MVLQMLFWEQMLQAGKWKLCCHIAISVVTLCLQEILIILPFSHHQVVAMTAKHAFRGTGRWKHPWANLSCCVCSAKYFSEQEREFSPGAGGTFQPGREWKSLQKTGISHGSAMPWVSTAEARQRQKVQPHPSYE